jgi:hypothetical protein
MQEMIIEKQQKMEISMSFLHRHCASSLTTILKHKGYMLAALETKMIFD